MGILLHIIARLLLNILKPVGEIFAIAYCLFTLKFKKISHYYMEVALVEDVYGNVCMQYLFNITLIKKDGYKFGNGEEKISSVIGKNKVAKKLTRLGSLIDKSLNKLDPNHSIKSIDNNV